MALNYRLPRWVTASVAELVRPIATDLGLTFFVEGVDQETPAWFQTDSLVLRVTGPVVETNSASETLYRFEVMTMLTDLLHGGENGYQNHDRLGTIANALCGVIPIFKYGDGDAQVGCLTADRKAREFLRLVQFGKLDQHSEVVQGAVVVKYEICLGN